MMAEHHNVLSEKQEVFEKYCDLVSQLNGTIGEVDDEINQLRCALSQFASSAGENRMDCCFEGVSILMPLHEELMPRLARIAKETEETRKHCISIMKEELRRYTDELNCIVSGYTRQSIYGDGARKPEPDEEVKKSETEPLEQAEGPPKSSN